MKSNSPANGTTMDLQTSDTKKPTEYTEKNYKDEHALLIHGAPVFVGTKSQCISEREKVAPIRKRVVKDGKIKYLSSDPPMKP